MPDLIQDIRDALRRDGPESASSLARRLGISTPTVTRALAKLGDAVVTIGKGRSSRYALRREVRDLGHAWPLYRIDADGQPELLGTIEALHGRYRWRLVAEMPLPLFMRGEFTEGLYEDLPWFLQALRPQGFLGKEFARRFGFRVSAPPDVSLWQSEDSLSALSRFGDDLPGNLALGNEALEWVRFRIEGIDITWFPQNVRDVQYPTLAKKLDSGDRPNSSAAGEQPKFTATLERELKAVEPVIVKFAPLVQGNPTAQRWADLLVCEEIALRLLMEHGIAAAPSEILDAGEWRFLQSTRFDRTPQGGRIGVFALDALDMTYIGSDQRSWLSGAEPLHAQGFIDRDDLERVRLLDAFGCLIGNNDMHFGNLSFFCEPDEPRIRLAPVYDMLPMHYRPAVSGLVREAPFDLPNLSVDGLDASRRALWSQARSFAIEFWKTTSVDERISAPFRSVCADNALRIDAWHAGFDS
jgi:DNA-binding transcriptional ArsR family regulator